MAGWCEQLSNFGVNYSTDAADLQALFRFARCHGVSRRHASQYFAFGASPCPGNPHALQTKCFTLSPSVTAGRSIWYACMICFNCSISNISFRAIKKPEPAGPGLPSSLLVQIPAT